MATLNGQTPEQIAKNIVSEAVAPQLIEIDGVTSQHLDKLARKANLTAIEALGERHWNKNRDRFRAEVVSNFINSAFKQMVKQIEKREQEMSLTYYNALIRQGMQPNEAHKLAFGNGATVEVVNETKTETVKAGK